MRKVIDWIKFIFTGKNNPDFIGKNSPDQTIVENSPNQIDDYHYYMWPDGSISVPEKDGTKPPR